MNVGIHNCFVHKGQKGWLREHVPQKAPASVWPKFASIHHLLWCHQSCSSNASKSTAMVYRSIHLLLIYCCIPIVTSFHYKDPSSSTLSSSNPLTLSNTSSSKSNSSNKMSDIFSDINVSGFPDDALPDHQKYEHPLVQRWVVVSGWLTDWLNEWYTWCWVVSMELTCVFEECDGRSFTNDMLLCCGLSVHMAWLDLTRWYKLLRRSYGQFVQGDCTLNEQAAYHIYTAGTQ